jgi:hypothetical protein
MAILSGGGIRESRLAEPSGFLRINLLALLTLTPVFGNQPDKLF